MTSRDADARMPDLEVEVKQRLEEVEAEVNLCNVSKDVILSHVCYPARFLVSEWVDFSIAHETQEKH